MTITIDPHAATQSIEHPEGGPDYSRQVVIDFGRPGQRYGLEIRDLGHWAACRLDSGDEGSILNHRAAMTLRAAIDT